MPDYFFFLSIILLLHGPYTIVTKQIPFQMPFNDEKLVVGKKAVLIGLTMTIAGAFILTLYLIWPHFLPQ